MQIVIDADSGHSFLFLQLVYSCFQLRDVSLELLGCGL
jgi:hypothetical protein